MGGPELNTVSPYDQTHLTEPVREKFEETAISPIQDNGAASDDDPMAITRRQSKRARDHGEDDGQVPPLEQEPRKKAAKAKQAEDAEDDEHITDATPDIAANIAQKPAAATQPQPTRTGLDSTAAPLAAVNGTAASGRKTPEKVIATESEPTMKDVASPTSGKRSRSEFQEETAPSQSATREKTASAEPEPILAFGPAGSVERATKRQRSASPRPTPPPAKVPPTSGFANTSASSPFGALAKPATDTSAKTSGGFGSSFASSPFGGPPGSKIPGPSKETSASAFAGSSFGSFANQSTSPFGAAAKTNGTTSVFATSAAGGPSAFSTPATAKLGFGSSAGGFGALAGAPKMSGFGGSTTGGGFGGLASGPKISGFGGPAGTALPPITGLSNASSTPFGAPATDKDDEDDEGSATEPDDDGDDGEDTEGKEKVAALPAKSKAEPVHITNGEENEDSLFISRARLYAFVADEKGESPAWRERGIGTLKINIDKDFEPEDDDDDAEAGLIQGKASTEDEAGKEASTNSASASRPKARLVMRQDGSNRLVLNSPVMKRTLFGDQPTGPMTVILLGLLPGHEGIQKLQLKMKAEQIKNFWAMVSRLQRDAP